MANGFFAKLQQGLSKTRENIAKGIDNVFNGFSNIDDDFYEELEETLIMGDIGIDATSKIIDCLRKQVKEKHVSDPAECKNLLVENIREQMIKNLPANAGNAGSIPGLGRSPRGGHGRPLQYSCLENPMDRRAGGPQSIW